MMLMDAFLHDTTTFRETTRTLAKDGYSFQAIFFRANEQLAMGIEHWPWFIDSVGP